MSFHVGETVGNYRIVGILGAGGAGRVFRVEHEITGRIEAMKVLLESDIQGPTEQAERFQREIKVQARLNHPNIASVHNAFWASERLVMVMEFVEGESLEDRLARGRIPLPAGVAYMRQALSALSYAHARGVTHRDVKPANLMVASQDGAIKVMDFGLARSGTDPRLTQTGAVIGSLYYISPEQVRASPHLDERTDIYSLGAVFYEVATGRKPFPCDQAFELMSAHVNEIPEPPVEIDASLPMSLSDAILRAMAKDPAERFASAADFLEALAGLAEWLPGETNGVSSIDGASSLDVPGAAAREQSAAPSHGAPAASEDTEPGKPRQARQPNSPSPKPGRKPFRRIFYTSAVALTAVLCATLLSVPAIEEAPVIEAAAPVSSSGFELLRRLRLASELTATSFSPDGHWVAAGTADHGLRIWSALTGQEEMSLSGHSARITALAFSPDSRSLASASADHQVKLWDLGGHSERGATLAHPSAVLSVAFSPNGDRLAAGTADEKVYLWEVAGGEAMQRLYAHGAPVLLAFSPSGEQLVASAGETILEVWDLSRGRERGRLLETERRILAFRFRPNGRSLVALSQDSLREWNLSSLRQLPNTSALRAIAFAFTPEGHCLALTGDRESVTVRDLTVSEEIGLLQHSAAVQAAYLSFDGLRAVTYTGKDGLWLWQARPALMAAQGAARRAAEDSPPGRAVAHNQPGGPSPAAQSHSDHGLSSARRTPSKPAEPSDRSPEEPVSLSGSLQEDSAENSSPDTDNPTAETSDEDDSKQKKGLLRRVIGVFR